MRRLPLLALIAVLAAASAFAADPAAPFPEAQPGEHRWRIRLPAATDETQLKVELIAGKTAMVDCNVHRLIGEFSEETLSAWGYGYYRLKSTGDLLGTLMACGDRKQTTKFVSGPTRLLPYNSRLPIIIYAPEGLEIRYRIWRAGETHQAGRD